MPTSARGWEGVTQTHTWPQGRPGDEVRSCAQGGEGNMMGQQSLPRALKGLFGRSDELLHTKPLRLAP